MSGSSAATKWRRATSTARFAWRCRKVRCSISIPPPARENFEEINLRKRRVRARTPAQDAYVRALKRHALVFSTGPAGTGKTWLAVAHAVQLFERKEVDRIVLSRPAVEAGERLGFLPGDMREKVDPYLRPIYDALYDLMDARIVERALQTTEIEIAPLAFMRGRTLSNAAIILDEAQNTTAMQMKMLLTRLGENSRMVVTGDPSQVDLPPGQTSGLAEAVRLLDGVEGIAPRHVLRPPTSSATSSSRASSRPTTRPRRQSASGRKWQNWRGKRGRRQKSMCSSNPISGKAAEDAGPVVRRAIAEAAATLSTPAAELAIVLTDDSAIRLLNRAWRGVDAATNVLSFPTGAAGGEPPLIGDIVLAYETIAAEAGAEGKPFAHHVAHLAVHGFPASVGLRPRAEEGRRDMERIERDILRRLAIPDPYSASRPGLKSDDR